MSSTTTERILPTAHKTYLHGLNSIRAIAALSVCFYHFTNGALPKVVIPAVKPLFSQGRLGVDVFFVLSGFIIPYSLLGKSHHISGLATYFKKRLIRINPPAYAAMLLTLGQGIFTDIFIHHNREYINQLTVGKIINNILFTVPFTDYHWITGIFWTLAIEFQFYIFIGLCFSLMFEHRHVGWFIGGYLIAQALQYVPALANDSFFQYSSLFALGGVALLWQQQRLSKLAYLGLILLFTSLAYFHLGHYGAATGLATMLAITLVKTRIPGLDFLGRISYSFYLLHLLIGTSSEFVLIKIISPTTVAHKLLITALAITLAIVVAAVFHRFVEQPFMRLASRKKMATSYHTS